MAVDNYILTLYKENGTPYNLTPMIGNLTWRDSIDTVGTELTFSKVHSDERYMSKLDVVEIGDKILLANNGIEVFRGLVTDEYLQGRFSRSYTCFDYAFYLNQSKTKPIQFNKEAASQVITRFCQLNGISIHSIPSISTKIDTIYKDKTPAEILLDILGQATNELGIRYKMEMLQGKLYIAKYSDLVISATYKLSENTSEFDIIKATGNISKQRSITDMRNSIIVTSSDEKSTRVYTIAQDDSSIKKYGLLQENISMNSKDLPQAANVAKNKLKELNKIAESTSIELLGNDKVKSGRILTITEPLTKLSGQYLVKECTHNYNNSIHKMSLTVESVVV